MKKFFFSMLTIGIVVAATAFTVPSSQKPTHSSPVLYRYLEASTSPTVFRDINKWEVISTPPSGCNDDNEVPCYVSYEGDFENFLNTASLQNLLDISQGTKTAQ